MPPLETVVAPLMEPLPPSVPPEAFVGPKPMFGPDMRPLLFMAERLVSSVVTLPVVKNRGDPLRGQQRPRQSPDKDVVQAIPAASR